MIGSDFLATGSLQTDSDFTTGLAVTLAFDNFFTTFLSGEESCFTKGFFSTSTGTGDFKILLFLVFSFN
jgi:hypothetical protein